MKDLRAIRFVPNTKISHDYKDSHVETFSYRQLWENKVPAIGIPAKQNNLVIIDVDVVSDQHQHDGREWWQNFCQTHGIPMDYTYTVKTASGGFHFYFKIPEGVNLATFSPPSRLADGVDVKYNGWVAAPPTQGYVPVCKNISQIAELPVAVLMEFENVRNTGKTSYFEDHIDGNNLSLDLHKPFTDKQIETLRSHLEWMQVNAELSRDEWRNGLFAIKAGVHDDVLMEELATLWTMNKAYRQGDEKEAIAICKRADRHGSVGPGTIFSIIQNVRMREGAQLATSDFERNEVFDKANIPIHMDSNGNLKIVPTESNIASIIGAAYDRETLYHDVRMDLYKFKGKVYSDAELVSILCPIIQSTTEGLGLLNIRKANIAGGLEVLMAQRKVDPHIEYLNNLEWDGVSRIDKFFSDYVGADDSEYTRDVSKNFWIALAGRGLNPGLKFDSIVIIEGREGIYKSSLIEAIGGEYTFAPSSTKSFDDIDDLRKMHQSIIVELPELRGLVGQDANKVKAFLSKSHDHIRGLFARKAMKHPRGFIFVGTTNDKKYLSLDMGERRFWPIKVEESKGINLNAISMDRDQLFAEAVARFRAGENFYTVNTKIFREEVKKRTIQDPLINAVSETVHRLKSVFTVDEVYQNLLMMDFVNKGLSGTLVKRIESCLTALGCEEIVDPVTGRRKWTSGLEIPEPEPAYNAEISLDSFI